jgi:hypothetical protein
MTKNRLKKVIDKRKEIDKEFKKKGVKIKLPGEIKNVKIILKFQYQEHGIDERDLEDNEYRSKNSYLSEQKKKLKDDILRKIMEDEEERKFIEEEIAKIKKEEVKIVNTINDNSIYEQFVANNLIRQGHNNKGSYYK